MQKQNFIIFLLILSVNCSYSQKSRFEDERNVVSFNLNPVGKSFTFFYGNESFEIDKFMPATHDIFNFFKRNKFGSMHIKGE
jgi:hypothetical protein